MTRTDGAGGSFPPHELGWQILLDDDLSAKGSVTGEVGDTEAAGTEDFLDDEFMEVGSWREGLAVGERDVHGVDGWKKV